MNPSAAASLTKNRLRQPFYEAPVRAALRGWPRAGAPLLLTVGTFFLWQGGLRGEAGWLIPAGILGLVAAGFQGVPWSLVLALIPIGALHYIFFLLPPMVGAGLGLPKALVAILGAAVWESAPLLAAVGLGALLNRPRHQAPLWVSFLVVAGAYCGISVWLPRPYGFAFAAPIVQEVPGLVWAFGCDLAGGLLLGMAFVILGWLRRSVPVKTMALVVLSALATTSLAQSGYRMWQGQCAGISRKVVDHDVLAIPGGLPPFISNYKTMSDRALYPMILFSAMQPDLIMGPENLIQANTVVDPDTEDSTLQRHITSIGTAVAVPFSQALFGVRDFHSSRVYFSDIQGDKPRVQWKDMEKRTPGVDVTIPWVQGLFSKTYMPSIAAPVKTPLMDLWKRGTSPYDAFHEDEVIHGLTKVSRAVICMSGEIRNPRLVQKIAGDKSITSVMNPNIGGWLGVHEAMGSSVQARARLLELGLIGYRVGQTADTELVVPWLEDSLPAAMAPDRAFLRFHAPLPYQRVETGYTGGLWIAALYLVPLAGLMALLGWVISAVPALRRQLPASLTRHFTA